MKAFFLTLLIVVCFWSCQTSLTKKDMEWVPYIKGEVLVFESSKHQLDSLYISNITSSISNRQEVIEVKCHFFKGSADTKGNQDTIHSFFMALTTVKESSAVLTVNLNRDFALFAPHSALRLTFLDSLPIETVETPYGEFNDVILLEPDRTHPEFLDFQKDSVFIDKLYWSKSFGLIKYELPNTNTSWVLVKKYRR